MRKEVKLPQDIAIAIRKFVDPLIPDTSRISKVVTIPAGTEFNIDNTVGSNSETSPKVYIGDVKGTSSAATALRSKQQELWDNQGNFIDTLAKAYLDRRWYLKLDIRSQYSTTDGRTALPGSYPRIGQIVYYDSTSNTHETGPAAQLYTSRGIETIDGTTYYTISCIFIISNPAFDIVGGAIYPKNVLQYINDSIASIERTHDFRRLTWNTSPTVRTTITNSTTYAQGVAYRLSSLNEVRISNLPNLIFKNPSSLIFRGTLNHAAANRQFRVTNLRLNSGVTINAYYCGVLTGLSKDKFFLSLNIPSMFFRDDGLAFLSGESRRIFDLTSNATIPIDCLLENQNLENRNSIIYQVTLSGEAPTIYFVRVRRLRSEGCAHYFAQHQNYSQLTSTQRRDLHGISIDNRTNITTITPITRSAPIKVTIEPNDTTEVNYFMFLVPTTETATSSLISIRQLN